MKVKIEFIDIILIGDEVNGRRPSAMLMGGCLWTIAHLETVLPLYEAQFKKHNERSLNVAIR